MRRILLALVCAVSVAGVAVAKSPAPEATATAPEGRRLSGDEIQDRFAGSSFYGVFQSDGGEWAEQTTADGRVLDLTNVAEIVGSWAVSGDKACYIYHQAPPAVVCYAMFEKNGNLLFYVADTLKLNARTTKITRDPGTQPPKQ